MKEFLPQNEHPLNQVAERLLHKLNLLPEQNNLYALQLVQQMVAVRKVGLLVRQREDVLDLVEDLMSEDPEKAMKYLLESAAGEQVTYNLQGAEKAPPEVLAQELVSGIRARMAAEAP